MIILIYQCKEAGLFQSFEIEGGAGKRSPCKKSIGILDSNFRSPCVVCLASVLLEQKKEQAAVKCHEKEKKQFNEEFAFDAASTWSRYANEKKIMDYAY
ncbi:hypothetical protein CEXT_131421 [Caerostris extrusa]|uniref:Uncharacterized protein n=1 Tax=Caerostris extrusa TaxID=172846 RepID=A0AAV4N606_CAEEX|nr:hypothetical protein CEXT_131421 [Caerostris extrusa]